MLGHSRDERSPRAFQKDLRRDARRDRNRWHRRLLQQFDAPGRPPASGNGGSSPAAGDAFPITIKHALGETVIEKKPERIATLGWANHEVPLALGVVPVGMSRANWGDEDGDGLLPWVKEKLDALGGQTPVLFDDTDGVPFEAVSNTKPDVILASYSGITAEDYATLSQVAPVVAYPEAAWITTMDQMIELNSQAMGMAAQGKALIADLDKRVAAAMEQHAGLKGKKVLFSFLNASDLSKVGFYTTHDPRAGFLVKAGLGTPEIVEKESAASKAFWKDMSSEKPELFNDVDILLTYGPADPTPLKEAIKADALLSRIPAIAKDHVVFLGQDALSASANPSPLSIPWGIEKYVAKLAEGLE
ncbi:MAG: iron-siderophore ABC transporter substrate-binding protein [Arachnia propionica]